MQLSLEQSINIYVNRFKEVYISNKFKYTSKFPYKCFNCDAIIYVPFEGSKRKDIFCKDCSHLSNVQRDKRNPQSIYLNEIKEKQLPIILSSLPEHADINLDNVSELKPSKYSKVKVIKTIDL